MCLWRTVNGKTTGEWLVVGGRESRKEARKMAKEEVGPL